MSLDLIDWAKKQQYLLVYSCCSNILRPLNIGCFGPFQLKYNQDCLSFPRLAHKKVTRFDVRVFACKAYVSALSPSKIKSAFS